MVGETISHCEVTEKIGQGGMGQVYRAADTKLNSDVALKSPPNCIRFPASELSIVGNPTKGSVEARIFSHFSLGLRLN
jgi:hypothetical protein